MGGDGQPSSRLPLQATAVHALGVPGLRGATAYRTLPHLASPAQRLLPAGLLVLSDEMAAQMTAGAAEILAAAPAR